MRQPPTLRWISEMEERQVLVTAISESEPDPIECADDAEQTPWPCYLRRLLSGVRPVQPRNGAASESC